MSNKMSNKELGLILVIIVAVFAVVGSVYSLVESLPINRWLGVVLILTPMAVFIVVVWKSAKGSGVMESENAKSIRGFEMKEFLKRYWLLTLFFAACGILVIYTITGIILGNIGWTWPGGYKGP